MSNYKLAPVSEFAFSIMKTNDNQANNNSGQIVDVTKLSEKELHKALFTLRKINVNELGSAASAFQQLPKIETREYDPELAKRYPKSVLQAYIRNFLKHWFQDSIEMRPVGLLQKKLNNVTGWTPPLHSVHPTGTVDETKLVVSTQGINIKSATEKKTNSLQKFQQDVKKLEAILAECDKETQDLNKKNACVTDLRQQFQNWILKEEQKPF